MEECRNCRFYQTEEDGRKQAKNSSVAICMRFPPVYAKDKDYSECSPDQPTQWFQPTVIYNSWCGEYKLND